MNDLNNERAAFISMQDATSIETQSHQPKRRYKRGYDTRHLPAEVRATLKEAEACRPFQRMREAALTVASIPAIGALTVAAILSVQSSALPAFAQTVLSVLLYLMACIAIARQLRGIEIMVHDASHLTWVRSRPRLNNFLADIFVGAPVLSSVTSYWRSHRVHHGHYGSHSDPCRQRFAAMGISDIDLSTHWKITRAVIRWLPGYNAAYYKEIGSQSIIQWAIFISWHSLVLVTPLSCLLVLGMGFTLKTGMALAVFGWVLFWVLPAMVFLPVIRSIAESEEHDYEAGGTEFETTYTNDGWLHRLLIHPKNDAYHVIHHLFPNIPEAEHKWVHDLLMRHDEKYRNALRREKLLNVA
ncbi:fatty acid desaturase [Cognatishimia maritima]|uniref:Fatty acid desaturase n=1 Tax=Cognatishimia maritima TaxID=870908 RepID=A0A1M5MUY7_9RHOB|nr:fatty acid desaturase [Cognatishimia maritima]SHG80593.1 Fatty acid desaturase [Cognatishimia maritima]